MTTPLTKNLFSISPRTGFTLSYTFIIFQVLTILTKLAGFFIGVKYFYARTTKFLTIILHCALFASPFLIRTTCHTTFTCICFCITISTCFTNKYTLVFFNWPETTYITICIIIIILTIWTSCACSASVSLVIWHTRYTLHCSVIMVCKYRTIIYTCPINSVIVLPFSWTSCAGF